MRFGSVGLAALSRAAAAKATAVIRLNPRSWRSAWLPALGLIAALFITLPARAGTITWDLEDVLIGNTFYFTGSFTVDSTTGLVLSANIQDQYFSNPPITLTTLVYPTGLDNQVAVANGVDGVDLVLTSGETFADNVPTLALDATSHENTTGCCGYIISGYLSNEDIPEPASLALLGARAAGLWLVRRRRQA
jgi:hypothetical protein